MKDTSSNISHPPSATSHQPRILVVDDEPDVCWALENILCPAGYAVTTTTRGAEALELLARQPYAVAFVDAKLPDLDGLELVALIRQQSPHTAVVLISGYYYREDPMVMEDLAKNLYVGFISKPFHLSEVRSMARRAANRTAKENDAESPHSTRGR
jgi:DNA-binding NtrC family response regulator